MIYRRHYIQHEEGLFLIIGIGNDSKFDYNLVFYCVRLRDTLENTLKQEYELVIPVEEALEVENKDLLNYIKVYYA